MAGVALRAMLAGVIDYAGCFPPASLPLADAVNNYLEYRDGAYAWMLGRFVIRSQDVASLPTEWEGDLAVVGADHLRASAVEMQTIAHFQKPTYCEVPLESLHAVQTIKSFAKLRMGGTTPSAIPETEYIAKFLNACAGLRVPFKATAGLHHPIRSSTHGFVNALFAASWLWSDGDPTLVSQILDETKATAFSFDDDAASWRGRKLCADQLQQARRDFMHSFGSCSFVEPVEELTELGWL